MSSTSKSQTTMLSEFKTVIRRIEKMNKYLVPMWSNKNHKMKNHLALIEASNRYQAMLIAIGTYTHPANDNITLKDNITNTTWHVDSNYKSYQECNNPDQIFTYMNSCDTIKTQKIDTEDTNMDIYDYIYWGDYNARMQELANKALPEKWSFEDKEDYSILKKYLNKTLERLQYENKIITTDKYCAFNTGLFTNNYEDIYILAEKSAPTMQSEWTFKEFCTEYRFDSTDITTLPERANYFEDPSLLIFDWHYPVRVQYGHILDDPRNQERLPQSIANSKMKLKIFTGVIDTSIKKVIANYKLAVPQYYNGQIQLLIPLYFEDDDKPDLALAVTKKNGYYQGHTCLTLDMAYNNARVIAKPECNWLDL